MADILSIPVQNLTEATITRARGAEAFEALVTEIKHRDRSGVVFLVDITGVDLVSQSFLDELVLRIQRFRVPGIKIGFRIGSDRDLSRLERICSIRGLRCTYQYGDSSVLRRTDIRKEPDANSVPFKGTFFDH